MTTQSEPPVLPPLQSTSASGERGLRPLTVAAIASLSAGAVHGAAVGAHSEHPAAMWTFVLVALFQLGWGAVALVRPSKAAALVGAVGNGVLVGGWVLAKSTGISFISGLDTVERIQFADALCAALAAVAAVAAATVFLGVRARVGNPRPALAGVAAGVLAIAALPGMVEAGNHVHSQETKTIIRVGGQTKVVTAAVVPPKVYDPAMPIDLSGVKGVSSTEQARAENLISDTLVRLPQWSDPAYAEAHGFKSIGDGVTGVEHYINYGFVSDNRILDPDHPESLVYRVQGTQKKLVSAMYMLKPGADLNTVPDVGGPLTQWHIHDNLCFTNDKVAPHVAGLTDANGNCQAPLVKLPSVPMIHVWIVPHPCGPFAALNGVGAGQVKAGETTNCDHVHGASGAAGL